jgi:hypothetical protein
MPVTTGVEVFNNLMQPKMGLSVAGYRENTMVQMDQRYKQASSIVSREIAGETILVPIRQNVGDLENIFTLNETAALAWGLMDGDHTLAEIQRVVEQHYDVATLQAQQDLLDLIEELRQIEAIEPV